MAAAVRAASERIGADLGVVLDGGVSLIDKKTRARWLASMKTESGHWALCPPVVEQAIARAASIAGALGPKSEHQLESFLEPLLCNSGFSVKRQFKLIRHVEIEGESVKVQDGRVDLLLRCWTKGSYKKSAVVVELKYNSKDDGSTQANEYFRWLINSGDIDERYSFCAVVCFSSENTSRVSVNVWQPYRLRIEREVQEKRLKELPTEAELRLVKILMESEEERRPWISGELELTELDETRAQPIVRVIVELARKQAQIDYPTVLGALTSDDELELLKRVASRDEPEEGPGVNDCLDAFRRRRLFREGRRLGAQIRERIERGQEWSDEEADRQLSRLQDLARQREALK